MFFWNSCFFHDPADVGNLISDSSAFSKTSLNIRKFMVHVLLKPGLQNFEHYFTSMWDECNCAVVWAFFGIAFLWNCNENWPFPVLWPLLSFPNLLAYWAQHFHSIIFQDLKQLNWILGITDGNFNEKLGLWTNVCSYIGIYILKSTLHYIFRNTQHNPQDWQLGSFTKDKL